MQPKLYTTLTRILPRPMTDTPSGGTSPPPPPPPPPPAPNGADKKFYEGWAPEVVAHIESSKYPDAQAIAAADMNARKLIGVPHDQLIKRPAQGFEVDPKPHIAALRVLGAPEKPDGYPADKLFAPVEGLGQLDAGVQKTVTDKFTELGILPWQAQSLMGTFYDLNKAQKATMDAATQAAATERAGRLDAYKAERGANFPKDVQGAKAIIAKFDRPLQGDVETLKAQGKLRVDENGVIMTDKDGKPIPQGEYEHWLNTSGQGSDPATIRMLAAIAERFDPSSFTPDGGQSNDQPGAMSKAGAAEEERRLRADQGFMKQYTTRGDPGHQAAVDKINALLKIQHG
jgi:hypothetical protein